MYGFVCFPRFVWFSAVRVDLRVWHFARQTQTMIPIPSPGSCEHFDQHLSVCLNPDSSFLLGRPTEILMQKRTSSASQSEALQVSC